MSVLGLGEHGEVFFTTERGRPVAMVYYRDFSGIRRRLRASGKSKAEARRSVEASLRRALTIGADGDFTPRSTLADGARGWLAMFEAWSSAAADRRRRWTSIAMRSSVM